MRGKLKEPTFEVTGTRVHSPDGFESRSVKRNFYQIKVENRGKTTAHDVRGRIHFFGVSNYDDESEGPDSEVNVDSRLCWDLPENPSSVSLHAGDGEWLNVFRMLEDFSGGTINKDEDVYLEFPTAQGWEERADIHFRHVGHGVSNTDKQMVRKAVHQTEWQDAIVEVKSEEATYEYEIDFEDVNNRIGVSLLFTEDRL